MKSKEIKTGNSYWLRVMNSGRADISLAEIKKLGQNNYSIKGPLTAAEISGDGNLIRFREKSFGFFWYHVENAYESEEAAIFESLKGK